MGRHPQSAIAGYTLLELMVVLAILATLTAVSLPMLRRPLNKSRLQDSAQQVGKALADLRLVAVQEGQTYLFRYQKGASGYQSCPAELFLIDPGQWDTESGVTTAEMSSSAGGSVGTAGENHGDDQLDTPATVIDMEILPDGTNFLDALLDPVVESRIDEQAVEDRQLIAAPDPYVDPAEDASVGSARWSTPVLFYPDGRATSVKLTLVSDDGYEIDIDVRGLTGAVRVGRLRRAEGAIWEQNIPEQPTP